MKVKPVVVLALIKQRKGYDLPVAEAPITQVRIVVSFMFMRLRIMGLREMVMSIGIVVRRSRGC